MNLNVLLCLFCSVMCRVHVQAWAQARERPICHHHARTPHTEVTAEGRREDAILLPIQLAAGLLGEELAGAKLLPESAEIVAEFALLLLTIFDQSHGQCPGPTTRDSLTHRLCEAYINYGDGLAAACMGRTTEGGALRCVCDELEDGVVAVCRSHTSPHARDLPLCHNSHTRGCRTAWSGLCATMPHPGRVREPPKSFNPHDVHKTLPKHAAAASHARAQLATRWGVRAAQRLAGAARRPPQAQRLDSPEPRETGPTVPTRTRLSFLFLMEQSISLDTISVGPPAGGRNITICATGLKALAAAQVILPQPWVSHQLPDNGLGELITSGCDGLATWPHHAESLFTNPCVNGAAAHPLCVAAAHDHPAFAVGARLLRDPHTSTVHLPQRGQRDVLEAEAEQHQLHLATCQLMRRTSGHHHLPHC
jgi:hypothetical protein